MLLSKRSFDHVSTLVASHQTPSTYEKDTYGEVFTPLHLAAEVIERVGKCAMYTKPWWSRMFGNRVVGRVDVAGVIYEVHSYWSNPELRILDPSAGIGNFCLVAYLFLDEGLKHVIQDTTMRRRHIIHNMLHMTELNRKNVDVVLRIFGKKANVLQHDYLSETVNDAMDKKWGVHVFDLVIGNPPFNQTKNHVYGGGHTLWDRFVVRAVQHNVRDETGLLAFIHPPAWRKPGHALWANNGMLKRYQIHYLSIQGSSAGKDVFGCHTRFDWYVLQKTGYRGSTTIRDIDGLVHMVDYRDWPFMPNGMFDAVWKVFRLHTDPDACFKVINGNSALGNKPNDTMLIRKPGLHPTIYSLNTENRHRGQAAQQRGTPKYIWVQRTPAVEHHLVPKVILSVGKYPHPIIDGKGRYTMSAWVFGLSLEHLADTGGFDVTSKKIVEALESDTFQKVMLSCKWSTKENTEERLFLHLPRDFYMYVG
jgi:hypothetical protein